MKKSDRAPRFLTFGGMIFLALLGAVPAMLRATSYTVNAPTDTQPTLGGAGTGTTGDLRFCLTGANSAAPGTTHTIAISLPGTITLGGSELVINSNVTINDPGANMLTIDANQASRVLFMASGHTATVNGVTLTGGNGIGNSGTLLDPGGSNYDNEGGALLNDGGVLTLNACVTSNSTNSTLIGGGVYNQARTADATLALNDCTVTGNSSHAYYESAKAGAASPTSLRARSRP